jgi:hypothetical protein
MGSSQSQSRPPANTITAGPRPDPLSSSGVRIREQLGNGGVSLSAPVGPGAPNRPKDVLQVERVLEGAGLLNRAAATRFDKDTSDAISTGQLSLNSDHAHVVGDKPLKIDGLINPGGPTQMATRDLARYVSGQWQLTDKNTPNDKVSAGDDAELHRLADGLSNSASPGPIAADISSAIRRDDNKAIMEYQTLRQRLADKGSPDQVQALDSAVLNTLPAEEQNKVKAAIQRDPVFAKDSAEYRMQAHERLREKGIKAAPEKWEILKRRNAAAEQEHIDEREQDRAERDVLNSPLPRTAKKAEASGFELQSRAKSSFHQNMRGKPELKYIHPDGREVIFDGDSGEVVTDPRIKGSFNYGPNPLSPTHWIKDIWPYLRLRERPNLSKEHKRRAKSNARIKIKSIRQKFRF